jgi:hypothetical protein
LLVYLLACLFVCGFLVGTISFACNFLICFFLACGFLVGTISFFYLFSGRHQFLFYFFLVGTISLIFWGDTLSLVFWGDTLSLIFSGATPFLLLGATPFLSFFWGDTLLFYLLVFLVGTNFPLTFIFRCFFI